MSSRVHLVIGNSTYLRERARSFNAPVWLVPTERHGHGLDRSFTFPQLALKLAAPPADQPLLSEPQQRLLLRQVIEELTQQRKLRFLGKLIDAPSGVSLIFSFISELKNLGASPVQFTEFAGEVAGRRHLDHDVALIYQSYQDLLTKHGFLDRDAVFQLAMSRKRWPALGDALLVDDFAAFTPPQLALLQRLATHIGETWLTLPGAGEESERFTAVELAKVYEAFPHVESHPSTLVKPNEDMRPSGLRHLSQHLFVENSPSSDDAKGILVIEAPGIVGEVRMVARAIKTQLNNHVHPESIVVAIRQLGTYADLIDETFTEYGIPFELDVNLSLLRVPVVAGLLKAASVASSGFQFADVSALLRNTLFRSVWPELVTDAELPLAADMLLRQLNEPRGREATLSAATRWAEAVPTPLEDEEAEKTQQAQIHELAKRCLPLMRRIFTLWDDAPQAAPFDAHIQWLVAFAGQLGWPGDDSALRQLHADLAGWSERERQIAPTRIWPHDQFLTRLGELAALANRPRSTAAAGQVRILPAATAAGLVYDHLYLPGLGERGFPDLSGGPSLYDQAERAAFRGVGLDLEVVAERLPAEKLLFLRLISGARQSLTLSYPATDEKGQELLPSSFLRTIRDDLFGQGPDGQSVIQHERRTMLIDGLDTDAPLSGCEERIRYARKESNGSQLTPDVAAHLAAVRRVGQQRYCKGEFSAYDGMLANVRVRKQVAQRFGPDRALSPTSLEAYISCPFKFYAGRVLKLTRWDDPSEEIEAHRRGSAYHRALTRLHRGTAAPAELGMRLSDELAYAIKEYADRAGSRTTKILWQLELERVQRSATNYTAHSDKHQKQWADVGTPRAEFLEEQYEIVVEHLEKRVKLGGRIDRIDVIETDAGVVGFLVVDYKTGRRGNHTKPAVERMESLQLAVYALAAEHRLGDVKPLGLLYWLPLDDGPKLVSSKKTFVWPEYRRRLEEWVVTLAEHIRAGEFPLQPRHEDSCNYCEFHRMCRIAQGQRDKTWNLPLPLVEDDVDE